MGLLDTGTVTQLSGINLRNWSARQLKINYALVDSGELAYDVNGTLRDLTLDQFRKYQFTLTAEDVNAPELEDVWKGKLVTFTVTPNSPFQTDSEDGPPRSFDCMLLNWGAVEDEWGAKIGWSIDLLQR